MRMSTMILAIAAGTALLMRMVAVGQPAQCNTRAVSSTARDCGSTGCDGCIEENADQQLWCNTTFDNTYCCVAICQPFNATYQRRTGECDGDCVCVWGAWANVTTSFDHTVSTCGDCPAG